MMSLHLALPREGHLKELYHIFAYLKARPNAETCLSFQRKTGCTMRMAMSL
jgi:hypothetical protein